MCACTTALHPQADRHTPVRQVPVVPTVSKRMRVQKSGNLTRSLVDAAEQWKRHCDAERFGGAEVEEHLNFRALLDRQLARLFALENAAGINAKPAMRIHNIAPVAHQGAGRRHGTKAMPVARGRVENSLEKQHASRGHAGLAERIE
jgi:hypothetical protein